jgi:hypothetical protein
MARYDKDEDRWIFYKAIDDGTLKVPKKWMSNLEFLNPNLKPFIVFEQNGQREYYEDANGIVEYNSIPEAEAAIPSVEKEFPNASNFKWSRWSLNGLRPKITWVLSYQLDGHFEIYEEWNGAAEYNSKAEAESVIKDVEYEYPNSTDWKAIRHPMT